MTLMRSMIWTQIRTQNNLENAYAKHDLITNYWVLIWVQIKIRMSVIHNFHASHIINAIDLICFIPNPILFFNPDLDVSRRVRSNDV